MQKGWEQPQIKMIERAIALYGSASMVAKMVGVHRQVISRWKLCHARMSLAAYLKLEKLIQTKERLT